MTELRNKILTFRALLDLSPCIGSASVNQLLVLTLKDLYKLYPCIKPRIRKSDIERAQMHQALNYFCDALKSIGKMWTHNDQWTVQYRDDMLKLDTSNLEHYSMGLLEDIIKVASERMFDIIDEVETTDDNVSLNSFEEALSDSCSVSSSPNTPTSVLPHETPKAHSSLSPLVMSLKVQTIEKLKPIDLKRLSFHMFPHVVAAKDSTNNTFKEQNADTKEKLDSELVDVVGGLNQDCDIMLESPKIIIPNKLEMIKYGNETNSVNLGPSNFAPAPPPLPSIAPKNYVFLAPLPPPPPLPIISRPLPPPPPPPTPMGKGVVPPPPPLGLASGKNIRIKKATKLKRSSQMGNLYRLLKGKVEGSTLDGKSRTWGKLGAGAKQGMADAIAEIAKRSAYFQQIEEDVKNHATIIMEMKQSIATFQTSDMDELINFHKYVESHLEKLTDESQVLARFEDFPTKKLEALRMAATLYSKLDGIASTLRNWPIVASPVNQLLHNAENYFSKIKLDLDKLERTKDEESVKFASHKITFDFSILVHIKELLVDVSSNCMELALKERREVKKRESEGQKKESGGKLLWKAFLFAYKVYTFAGGHDDRADNLTRELAREIETDPQP